MKKQCACSVAYVIHDHHSTMFKKPLGDAKTSGISIFKRCIDRHLITNPSPLAPLRSSERRKLRARIAERFQLAPDIADNLVPDGLLSQKFSAYNGEPGVSV